MHIVIVQKTKKLCQVCLHYPKSKVYKYKINLNIYMDIEETNAEKIRMLILIFPIVT